ncbi:MAG: hypothetical protein WCV85_04715 [Patescibacteria group bacterium]|jgi:hypothetical protein
MFAPKITKHLNTILVDYDDQQWQTIDKDRYASVEYVELQHFPVRGKGRNNIRFRLVPPRCKNASNHAVTTQLAYMHCRLPDRAEAETVIRSLAPEILRRFTVIALAGERFQEEGFFCQPYVGGKQDGVYLALDMVSGRWDRRHLFVAIARE